jgi:hypothetical protein
MVLPIDGICYRDDQDWEQSCRVATAADDRLDVTGREVVVRRERADAVRDAADVKVLGGLLPVEEAVVASAHPTDQPLAVSKKSLPF